MSKIDEIADSLAKQALELADKADDERVIEEIAKQIGTSSPTVEEAFRTMVRMRRAELRAKTLMATLESRLESED